MFFLSPKGTLPAGLPKRFGPKSDRAAAVNGWIGPEILRFGPNFFHLAPRGAVTCWRGGVSSPSGMVLGPEISLFGPILFHFGL